MTTKIPVELSSTPSIVDGGNATAITIDSSERIGIGTSSPDRNVTIFASNPVLNIKNSTANLHLEQAGHNGYVGNNSSSGFIQIFTNNGNSTSQFNADGSFQIGAASIANLKFSQSSDVISITAKKDGTDDIDLAFLTQASGGTTGERMRITSSGEVLIGTTGSGAAGALYINASASNSSVGAVRLQTSDYQGSSDLSTTAISVVKSSNDTTTSQTFIRFGINSFSAGSGQINANGASQCAFGTFSDRTLKENITDLPTQLDKIKTLRPVEFDYIESQGGGHQLGFIAQEVEEIYPDMVGETEGKKTLAGLGKWEARLIKAIQELSAKVEELEGKIE